METYSSSNSRPRLCCEHIRICAAPQTRHFTSNGGQRYLLSPSAPGGACSPPRQHGTIDVALQKRGARAAGCLQNVRRFISPAARRLFNASMTAQANPPGQRSGGRDVMSARVNKRRFDGRPTLPGLPR